MNTSIATQRLMLRPWREDDCQPLERGLNDLSVAQWLAFVPHPYTERHAKAWITKCQGLSTSGSRPIAYEFAVVLRHERTLIGGVSLNNIDWSIGAGGGGVWIASQYHGYGYGREAFEAKIRFAFRDLGLKKLINGYFAGNEKSSSMQCRLGYKRVGEVPRRCMADGTQKIEHVTTLLSSDWEDLRANPFK